MKTLHLVISAILVLALGTSGTAHGQSAASTASILTVWTDKSNYSANDTVTVAGYVDKSETRFVHKLQVAVSNPNGIWYKQDQFPVDQDGRFSYQFKIEGDLAVGGHYLVRVWSLDESGIDVGTSFNVDSAINSSVVNILVKQGATELAYSGDNITETIEYNITVEPKFLGSLYVDIFKNSHLLRTDTLGTPDIVSFFGTGGQYYYYKLTISGKKDQDVYKINFRYDGKSVEKVIPLTSTRNGIINGTTTNVTPQRAKIDVTFNKKASHIVITGTVYKLFSTIIVLKIQNPQGNLIAVSQLQPAPDGTFSLTIVPSNPLWSMQGNYTVTVASDSQELVKTTFYFDGNVSSQITSNGINTLGLTLSPLKQYETGLAAKDVTCKSDFQLVIKSKDGSPACVKPDTAKKLIQRGWAIEKLDPRFTSMDLEVYGSYNPGTLSGHFLKGSLSSIEGPISNGNVTIYVNGILMGQTVTDLSGCFQFNSWDDKKLSAQINETRQDMEQKGVLDGMNLRVVANYSGNENHGATNVTKQSYLYLWALPLPPPNYQTTISPSVLNVTQGYPIHFELMVKPFTTYSNVDMMKLSVGQMPCGVTDAISYNKGDDRVSTDHPGIFNVTLNTSSYTPTGTYWIMITQNTSGLSNPNIDHDITEFALKVLPKDN